MITHTEYITENDKKIDVVDGALPLSLRLHIYTFCRDSLFRIGWGDTNIPERKSRDYFLYSAYSDVDVQSLGILPYINNAPISNLIGDLKISKTIVNLGIPSDANHVHTHLESKVLLYYINPEWLSGWHGETLFYSEDLTGIQFASPYTPGRIIVFDANIPHTIRPQSSIAVHHRLTLSMFYE